MIEHRQDLGVFHSFDLDRDHDIGIPIRVDHVRLLPTIELEQVFLERCIRKRLFDHRPAICPADVIQRAFFLDSIRNFFGVQDRINIIHPLSPLDQERASKFGQL